MVGIYDGTIEPLNAFFTVVVCVVDYGNGRRLVVGTRIVYLQKLM